MGRIIAAIILFLSNMGRWVMLLGRLRVYLASIWTFILSTFKSGHIWAIWMFTSVFMFIISLFRGNAGMMGGILNNALFSILDRFTSSIPNFNIRSAFDAVDPRIINLLGYIGAIEAFNVFSLGLVTLMTTYITWWIILSSTKIITTLVTKVK